MTGEGVQGEVAEEVAAKTALHLVKTSGGRFDPGEAEG